MENYSLILLIYSSLIFVSYMSFIISKFGILPSISESYYKLEGGYKSLFSLFIFNMVIPVIIVGNNPLMFLAGLFIAFVGAAPAFKEEFQKQVHDIGAYGGIITAFISLWINFHLGYLSLILGLFFIYAIPKNMSEHWFNGIKNHIWWVEILSFILIITGLFLSI